MGRTPILAPLSSNAIAFTRTEIVMIGLGNGIRGLTPIAFNSDPSVGTLTHTQINATTEALLGYRIKVTMTGSTGTLHQINGGEPDDEVKLITEVGKTLTVSHLTGGGNIALNGFDAAFPASAHVNLVGAKCSLTLWMNEEQIWCEQARTIIL